MGKQRARQGPCCEQRATCLRKRETMMAKKKRNETITTVTQAHHVSGIVEAPDSGASPSHHPFYYWEN